MSMFVCNDGKWSLESSNPSLKLELDTPSVGGFSMNTVGGLAVSSLEAIPGEYPESLGMRGSQRSHLAEDGFDASLVLEQKIPFGVPISIVRSYRVDDDSMDAVVNFQLPHAFPLKNLIAGGLKFSGAVSAASIVAIPAHPGAIGKPKDLAFADAAEGAELYRGTRPPLMLSVVGNDGRSVRFELGCDIWRWCNAERLGGGKATYIIRKENNALLFTWTLYAFGGGCTEVPEPPFGRNWKLEWSLHWNDPAVPENVIETASLDDFADDCACAKSSENAMKKWIRRHFSDLKDGDTLVLKVGTPRFCGNAAHVDRAAKKNLDHWELPALRDFSRWANRQLRKHGASLILAVGKESEK